MSEVTCVKYSEEMFPKNQYQFLTTSSFQISVYEPASLNPQLYMFLVSVVKNYTTFTKKKTCFFFCYRILHYHIQIANLIHPFHLCTNIHQYEQIQALIDMCVVIFCSCFGANIQNRFSRLLSQELISQKSISLFCQAQITMQQKLLVLQQIACRWSQPVQMGQHRKLDSIQKSGMQFAFGKSYEDIF